MGLLLMKQFLLGFVLAGSMGVCPSVALGAPTFGLSVHTHDFGFSILGRRKALDFVATVVVLCGVP